MGPGQNDIMYHSLHIRVFAKAEYTNPILPQKIRRTNKYCCIPQNKGHQFRNITKFCGATLFLWD